MLTETDNLEEATHVLIVNPYPMSRLSEKMYDVRCKNGKLYHWDGEVEDTKDYYVIDDTGEENFTVFVYGGSKLYKFIKK